MLTALIGTYEEGAAGLMALDPLVGAALVAHQARRAVAAGAGLVVLLAPHVPEELRTAMAHLRRDYITIEVAANLTEAAVRVDAGALVLVIRDGILPDTALLAARPDEALLFTLAAGPELERYERIEGGVRWAGVARLPAALLSDAAGHMADGWDPLSTLLRRAVQQQVPRVDVSKLGFAPPILLGAGEDAAAEQALLADRGPIGEAWIGRPFGWVSELAMPHLARRRIAPLWLTATAAVLALMAALPVLARWPSVGLALLLIGGPLATLGVRLAGVRAQRLPHQATLERIRRAGAALALAALTLLVARDGQWGWWLVAALVPASLALLPSERAIARRLGTDRDDSWLATPDALIWIVAPIAVAGWGAALVAMAVYALCSLARVRLTTMRTLS